MHLRYAECGAKVLGLPVVPGARSVGQGQEAVFTCDEVTIEALILVLLVVVVLLLTLANAATTPTARRATVRKLICVLKVL